MPALSSAPDLRQLLEALLQRTSDGVILGRPDGAIVRANPAACRMLGWTEEELCRIGRGGLVVDEPGWRGLLAEREARGFTSGRLKLRHADGRLVPVELTTSILPALDGGRYTSVIFRDLTPAQAASNAVAQSEARFRALVEEAADPVFLHDFQGRLREVNRSACESLGYSREELLRMSLFEVEVDVDLAAAQRTWIAVRPGVKVALQGRQRRKDGTTFPVEVHLARLDFDGESLILGACRDVTERVEREAALLATQRALRLLVATNEAVLRAADEAALLREVCRVAVEQGGVRLAWAGVAEPGPERRVRPAAWHGDDGAFLLEAEVVWREGRGGPTGEALRSGRVVAADPGGATDPALEPCRAPLRARGYRSYAALPLVFGEERLGVVGVYSAAPDAFGAEVVELLQRVAADVAFGLSALRARAAAAAAAAQLRALTARLQEIREEEKARIARDLHDDLGQVLTALQLELQGAEERVEGLGAEVAGPILDHLVAAGSLASSTIEAVQRIARNLRSEALERVGLDAALRQELRLLERRTGLAVSEELAPVGDLDPRVSLALFRIAQEALTNVVRHSGARRVEVRLAAAGGALRLEIADDGRGLPAGLGAEDLGLLGMRERAREHGGDVTVTPREGGGTRVAACVPLAGGGAS